MVTTPVTEVILGTTMKNWNSAIGITHHPLARIGLRGQHQKSSYDNFEVAVFPRFQSHEGSAMHELVAQ